MQDKYKISLSLLGSVLIIPLYIILHEGGHSLLAILCGARITKFSIVSAYISYDGGKFNTFTLSLLNLAGMLLPLILSFFYLLFYRKDNKSVVYRVLSFFFGLIPSFSLIAWIVIPITYLYGKAPLYDDVTKFLNTSGVYPLWVTFASIILLLAMIILAWHKHMIQNYVMTIRLLNKKYRINGTD